MSDLDQQRSRKLLKKVASPKLNSFNVDRKMKDQSSSSSSSLLKVIADKKSLKDCPQSKADY